LALAPDFETCGISSIPAALCKAPVETILPNHYMGNNATQEKEAALVDNKKAATKQGASTCRKPQANYRTRAQRYLRLCRTWHTIMMR
jgi:hypothetical protein